MVTITNNYRRSLMLAVMTIGFSAASPLMADTIAIIGTGNVGGALGPEFAAQGHTVVYGSREPERPEVQELVARTSGDASATSMLDAVVGADMVVIAVPGGVAEVVVRGLGDLSGKIIIDPTNRVAPGEDGFSRSAGCRAGPRDQQPDRRGFEFSGCGSTMCYPDR